MSDREHAHQLIDRLPEPQVSALVGLLETIVDPVAGQLPETQPQVSMPVQNLNTDSFDRKGLPYPAKPPVVITPEAPK